MNHKFILEKNGPKHVHYGLRGTTPCTPPPPLAARHGTAQAIPWDTVTNAEHDDSNIVCRKASACTYAPMVRYTKEWKRRL